MRTNDELAVRMLMRRIMLFLEDWLGEYAFPKDRRNTTVLPDQRKAYMAEWMRRRPPFDA